MSSIKLVYPVTNTQNDPNDHITTCAIINLHDHASKSLPY